MELRHLDALLAIAEEGSFTAAADALHTVQSNVSDMVRQLETELGAALLVRSRRGAEPTEFGVVVLDRARRIRSEMEALRQDISMLRGLEAGRATLGIVGTISRWLAPSVVAALEERAAGVHVVIHEAASERLAAEVAEREIAQAVVTEPIVDSRLLVEHLLEEDLVALVPRTLDLGEKPVVFDVLAAHRMILPPVGNPLRAEIDQAARAAGVELRVPVEVEGVRLIADLVAAGAGITITPATAAPTDSPMLRTYAIADMPPRRLALVTARDGYLSLADRTVRSMVISLVRSIGTPPADQPVASTDGDGAGGSGEPGTATSRVDGGGDGATPARVKRRATK
jgi:LysR family hydrogen peroxide-inducible transcriptional activator